MTPLDPLPNNAEQAAARRSAPTPIFSEQLPIGLVVTGLKAPAEKLDLTAPVCEEEGLVLTFLHSKEDLRISYGSGQEYLQEASQGLGLLSVSNKPLHFRSDQPASVSVLSIFISRAWIGHFM